jgi:TPP-dependent pyruvate/acetoin dehydrogenase alpha subunit
MDVVAVEAAARDAAAAIRAGEGPQFLECRTYRFRAHSMFDPQLYRGHDEVEQWKEHGPLVRFTDWLKEAGLLHEEDIDAVTAKVEAAVEAAVAFAESGTWEPVETLLQDVYTKRAPA